ncbi:hypothetical protein LZ32DRAFT_286756 [Colletotrichum eremochloae]|nr:hypothetical protein LZ32DRAFT_286756 [Colletotrichum eremochloae]
MCVTYLGSRGGGGPQTGTSASHSLAWAALATTAGAFLVPKGPCKYRYIRTSYIATLHTATADAPSSSPPTLKKKKKGKKKKKRLAREPTWAKYFAS